MLHPDILNELESAGHQTTSGTNFPSRRRASMETWNMHGHGQRGLGSSDLRRLWCLRNRGACVRHLEEAPTFVLLHFVSVRTQLRQ